MTRLRKRLGAWVLAGSMVLSMLSTGVPGLAAGAGGSTPDSSQESDTYVKPELVMDFLGDNKKSYGASSEPGSGIVPGPKDTDQASADNGADRKWDGYIETDVGSGAQTIFWVGIGIRNMDQFVLSNGGKGLQSLELALYYNEKYAKPYIPAGSNYLSYIQNNNLSASGNTVNAWALADYAVTHALTDQSPINDPVDAVTGYGTEEFSAAEGWKMTYLGIERKEGSTYPARFSGGPYVADKTYYIAAIPFVLTGYDPSNALCIRLARNASAFSIGSANDAGGQLGYGEYGNWDKYTYHDPDHDLKLMFDYTGDLNIFTNEKVKNDQKVKLVFHDGGNASNTAQLTIHNEPFPTPSQIADANGEEITGLSGGEELLLKIHKVSGNTVTIKITTDSSETVEYTLLSANANTGNEEYTFIMPTGPDVTAEVVFSGSSDLDTEYTAKLTVLPDNYNLKANTARLTIPGGSATPSITANNSANLKVTANTSVSVEVSRNSDYDVIITAVDNAVTLTAVSVTETSLVYRFAMPANDVEIQVKFELAKKYTAEISVDHANGMAGNWGRLSCVGGDGSAIQSDQITGAVNPGDNVVRTIETRNNRLVAVSTGCDPAYQIKSVTVYRNGNHSITVPVTQNTTDPTLYSFTMPSFNVDVVVDFEPVQLYKVKLVIVDAQGDEGATLTGDDSRADNPTTNVNNGVIQVFSNAAMQVLIQNLGERRTAEVTVTYPGDVINTTGSAATGFNFNMVALDDPDKDEVVVTVTFKDEEREPLKANIRQEYVDGADTILNSAVWTGTNHNNTINVYEGNQLSVDIAVEPGAYISRIQVLDQNGDPLPVPVSLSGDGYNGGLGNSEQAGFTMPDEDATLLIEYTKGTPPEEPVFHASIRVKGTGQADPLTIENVTQAGTPGSSVGAHVGDSIKAVYGPKEGSYITGVTVEADVPGTAVDWSFSGPGGLELTMPAANVVVTVTCEPIDPENNYKLTLSKDSDTQPGNTVYTKTSGGEARVPELGAIPDCTNAQGGELVTLQINVAAGYHIESVTLTDGTGTQITDTAVSLSGTGYHSGAGGTETASFTMPAGATTATVRFKEGAPAPSVTLKVTEDPAGAGNQAILESNHTTANAENPAADSTVTPGQTVGITVEPVDSYSVDMPILVTPSGIITPTWTATDHFEFVMPNEPVTITVPFRKGPATQFRADLILRCDDPDVLAQVLATFGDYARLEGDPANHVYSRTAQAGESVPFAVKVPDGYHISAVTVTPEDFGVVPAIGGMIGTQSGDFHMPAGNVYLNIYIEEGWPDTVGYPVTLHVTDPDRSASSATLTNTVTGDSTGPVVGNNIGQVRGLDGTTMRVEITPENGHTLDTITVVGQSGDPVSYSWAAATSGAAVEFKVPGSAVDVYVTFKTGTPAERTVTLHTKGGTDFAASGSIARGSEPPVIGDGAQLQAVVGDSITVNATAGYKTLITAAYAQASDGSMVKLDPGIMGSWTNASSGFTMPFDLDVDVYLEFSDKYVPEPDENQHVVTLMVTGDPGSGKVELSELDAASGGQVGATVEATAVGGGSKVVNDGNTVVARVKPNTDAGYDLYSLTATTASGDEVTLNLDAGNLLWNTYTFTMPADTVHVEAEFRKVDPDGYQIQVVVRNTVNNGEGVNNDANLYFPHTSTSNPFKLKQGAKAGEIYDLALTVDTGYQVTSITAVPQNSGVAANIPLPLTAGDRCQVRMPASDLVIYVVFGLDTTTRYNVRGLISYDQSTAPTEPAMNELTLTGANEDNTNTGRSYLDSTGVDQSTVALIQEGQGKTVKAVWTPADGYRVVRYTVTTATGQNVLSQPMGDGTGLLFTMPNAPVTVEVFFAKTDVSPTYTYTATLHKVDAGDGDQATITARADTTKTTSDDGGKLEELLPGDVVEISAAPGTGRFIQDIYVLQNGQVIPLTHEDANATPHTGDFYMPSGNVDVYVVFTDTQPDPDSHTAILQVNGPNENGGSAVMFQKDTPSNTTAQAVCNQGPQSIVVPSGKTVEVQVTVNSGYAIDKVEGTPIYPGTLVPEVNPAADGSTVYTFVMPADTASVIVTLKAVQAVTYKLNLHVSHVGSGTTDSSNSTSVSYGDGGSSIITVMGSGEQTIQAPAGTEMTLTVRPQAPAATELRQGYFVRAAYAVYNNALVPLSRNLEKMTYANVSAGTPDNFATFTMPAGVTDVYVVYEYGLLPEKDWYNVVVIATDTGGATANTGASEVRVSSRAPAGDPTAIPAIPTPVSVLSNGSAVTFQSVPEGETIHLDATHPGPGYQYDTMTLSAQVGGTTLPGLTNPDQANHPLGDVQEFVVAAENGNVAVHVNFKTSGVTGLKATMHIVNPKKLTGNTATMSVGVKDGLPIYREVVSESCLDGDTRVLTDLVGSQTVSVLVDPLDATTRVVQVVVTKTGDPSTGSQLSRSSSDQLYTYVMEDKDVDIYVVLTPADDSDLFVAVAQGTYGDEDSTLEEIAALQVPGNEVLEIENLTTSGLDHAPIWTQVRGGDQTKTTFTANAGVYVKVTAFADGVELPVAQFGVGNGSQGTAFVDTPDPGCDVEIYVNFTNDPPEKQELTFISTGHEGKAANVAELLEVDKSADPETTTSMARLVPPNAEAGKQPEDDLIAKFVNDGTTDNRVTSGTDLRVHTETETNPEFKVKKVEVVVHTDVGDVTTTYKVDTDGNLDLLMPTSKSDIIVYFTSETQSPAPYDPENSGSDLYEDGWIRVENRGSYAIVTVPTLADEGGTQLYNVDPKEPKKHTFQFYLMENASGDRDSWEPTSLENVVELSHPDPDNNPDSLSYENEVYYTAADDTEYKGARFILRVKSDEDLTEDADKTLAQKLRDILDNQGTDEAVKNKTYLLITAMDYEDDPPLESRFTDVEVPKYYALEGMIESYAPTHPALVSLYPLEGGKDATDPDSYVSTPVYIPITDEVVLGKDENGQDLWVQKFSLKSSELFGKTGDGMTYRLVIEKAAHITYEQLGLTLDDTLLDEADGQIITVPDLIPLIAGDLDGDSMIRVNDRGLLMYYLGGTLNWTQDQTGSGEAWDYSVYNPDSLAYWCDLNGDHYINVSDLAVMMDARNYNKSNLGYLPITLGTGSVSLTSLLEEGQTDWVPGEIDPGQLPEELLPTEEPTEEPVEEPTEEPTVEPAEEPAEEPVEEPVEEPTEEPTEKPVEEPTEEPTKEPVEDPMEEPTEKPVEEPTEEHTENPVEEPTEEPAEKPVEGPVEVPTEAELPAEHPQAPEEPDLDDGSGEKDGSLTPGNQPSEDVESVQRPAGERIAEAPPSVKSKEDPPKGETGTS